ncbi:LPXTG specific sortase A [Staphylococcus aureus]|uniref:hypothetical protein n=1 Tax=Staphylococcus aureus TaxID=1280 RepID=UPI000F6D79C5|nr:hypothetical protein [Staphylococcus aureus]VEE69319.1 LPXTG specific sortase A [Staphylococcus aureus]
MKKWTNRLMTIAGVVLILVAAYLFAKPHIDNYLHDKDKDEKIEQYDKNVKEQASKDKKQQAKPQIPKDKSKVAGYIEIPDADIKEPVYPGPATPEQLNRGVSFAEENESLDDQKGKDKQLTLITCDDYNEKTGVWETRKIFVATEVK